VESILHKLLLAANMDVQAAQGGIVYIDEIDKLDGGRVQSPESYTFCLAASATVSHGPAPRRVERAGPACYLSGGR
jgi:hypothetical protein